MSTPQTESTESTEKSRWSFLTERRERSSARVRSFR